MDNIRTGNLIKQLRSEKNLTQQELADKIGVSAAAVSKWENGKGFPDISLIEPLSETLGITIGEIIRGERNTSAAPEDDSVAKEIINLSNSKRKTELFRKIFVAAILSFSVAVFFSYIVFSMISNLKAGFGFSVPFYSFTGMGAFLFGINALVFSVFCLFASGKISPEKSMQISLFSESCCAAAIWMNLIYIEHKVAINDISAIMDTAGGIELLSRLLFIAVTLINVFAYCKTAKNR